MFFESWPQRKKRASALTHPRGAASFLQQTLTAVPCLSSTRPSDMPLLLRTLASRAAPALRGHTVTQRANIYSKPAREKIGAVETAIGLVAMSVAILGPSGWILSHLEDYKKKE